MTRSTLEWYELLARGLLWAAGIVFLLSMIGTVVIAGSDNSLPVLEDVERQGRGIAALASLGGGLTAAGLLGGLGAILRLLVADRLAALPPEPEPPAEPAKPSRAAKPPRDEETRPAKKPPRRAKPERKRENE